jgi:hypothetical protein
LTGYTLLGDDNGSGCDDPLLLPGLKIAARGFLIVWADDDRYQGLNHAPFKLAKHGETIRLYDGTRTEVETVTYPALEDKQAYGRSGDGCGAWAVLDGASPGRPNAALLPSGETSRGAACLRSGATSMDTAARNSAPVLSQSPVQMAPPPPAPVPCGVDDCGCAAGFGWSGSASSCADGGHTSASEATDCRANGGPAAAAVPVSGTVPVAGCAADVNSSGDVGVADLLLILGAYGYAGVCGGTAAPTVVACDVNADCEVGVADILLTLSSFGINGC